MNDTIITLSCAIAERVQRAQRFRKEAMKRKPGKKHRNDAEGFAVTLDTEVVTLCEQMRQTIKGIQL
jgi:hypothetical protein